MCFTFPTQWVSWSIITPFIAWIGPTVIILIVGGIERVIYCLVYPKRVFTRDWFKYFFILVYAGAIMVISFLLAHGVSDKFTKEDSSG